MAIIQRELKPWGAPNFAVEKQPVGKRQDGFKPASNGIPASEMPAETLNEMAAEWLSDLYRKAGKHSPWKNMG